MAAAPCAFPNLRKQMRRRYPQHEIDRPRRLRNSRAALPLLTRQAAYPLLTRQYLGRGAGPIRRGCRHSPPPCPSSWSRCGGAIPTWTRARPRCREQAADPRLLREYLRLPDWSRLTCTSTAPSTAVPRRRYGPLLRPFGLETPKQMDRRRAGPANSRLPGGGPCGPSATEAAWTSGARSPPCAGSAGAGAGQEIASAAWSNSEPWRWAAWRSLEKRGPGPECPRMSLHAEIRVASTTAEHGTSLSSARRDKRAFPVHYTLHPDVFPGVFSRLCRPPRRKCCLHPA